MFKPPSSRVPDLPPIWRRPIDARPDAGSSSTSGSTPVTLHGVPGGITPGTQQALDSTRAAQAAAMAAFPGNLREIGCLRDAWEMEDTQSYPQTNPSWERPDMPWDVVAPADGHARLTGSTVSTLQRPRRKAPAPDSVLKGNEAVVFRLFVKARGGLVTRKAIEDATGFDKVAIRNALCRLRMRFPENTIRNGTSLPDGGRGLGWYITPESADRFAHCLPASDSPRAYITVPPLPPRRGVLQGHVAILFRLLVNARGGFVNREAIEAETGLEERGRISDLVTRLREKFPENTILNKLGKGWFITPELAARYAHLLPPASGESRAVPPKAHTGLRPDPGPSLSDDDEPAVQDNPFPDDDSWKGFFAEEPRLPAATAEMRPPTGRPAATGAIRLGDAADAPGSLNDLIEPDEADWDSFLGAAPEGAPAGKRARWEPLGPLPPQDMNPLKPKPGGDDLDQPRREPLPQTEPGAKKRGRPKASPDAPL
jgi:hypothetical protein